jgi:hypothetical protein
MIIPEPVTLFRQLGQPGISELHTAGEGIVMTIDFLDQPDRLGGGTAVPDTDFGRHFDKLPADTETSRFEHRPKERECFFGNVSD